MRRHEIADDHWGRIEGLLPGRPGDPGVTAKDNRLFVNVILWIGKTGAPWRDLPERFGKSNSVEPQQLALPTNAQLRVIRFDQGSPGLNLTG
jgi:transposase